MKSFHSEQPLIHILHRRMLDVTWEVLEMFIKMFIKAEHIPYSVNKLIKLDATHKSIQKPDKHLGVSRFSFPDLNKARLDKPCAGWISKFYTNLRTGYIRAGQKLLQLPLSNQTLRQLSVIDPSLLGHSRVLPRNQICWDKWPTEFEKDGPFQKIWGPGELPIYDSNGLSAFRQVEKT